MCIDFQQRNTVSAGFGGDHPLRTGLSVYVPVREGQRIRIRSGRTDEPVQRREPSGVQLQPFGTFCGSVCQQKTDYERSIAFGIRAATENI